MSASLANPHLVRKYLLTRQQSLGLFIAPLLQLLGNHRGKAPLCQDGEWEGTCLAEDG